MTNPEGLTDEELATFLDDASIAEKNPETDATPEEWGHWTTRLAAHIRSSVAALRAERTKSRELEAAMIQARDAEAAAYRRAEGYAASAAAIRDWKRVADGHPERHREHLVRRNGRLFTATPCYGMHEPWWVVRTMGGEAPPVVMRPSDEWAALGTDEGVK